MFISVKEAMSRIHYHSFKAEVREPPLGARRAAAPRRGAPRAGALALAAPRRVAFRGRHGERSRMQLLFS